MDSAARWDLTLLALQGHPPPQLPALPGRRHVMTIEARDRFAEAWEKLNRRPASSSRPSVWAWSTSRANELGGK